MSVLPAGDELFQLPESNPLVHDLAVPEAVAGTVEEGQLGPGPETGEELVTATTAERLVKSADRVRDLGEVFTPAGTVQAMLDMLPNEMWEPHPAPTFLEPSCGDGNFLVAILARKLERITHALSAGGLPAGTSVDAVQFHALETLSSIYAVDISPDNIWGGTPGHEVGARTRLLNLFCEWNHQALGKNLTARSSALRSAEWIVQRNLVVGNMLPTLPDGRPTGRDDLPLIEYEWQPADLTVKAWSTTLGAVLYDGRTETTGVMSLFGPPAPTLMWSGKAEQLGVADAADRGRQA